MSNIDIYGMKDSAGNTLYFPNGGGGASSITAQYEEATALNPHEVGDYIWLETDETIYLVTATISVGDSIVYGTNITDSGLTENSIVGIKNMPGSGGEGGSGGHIIVNASGTEMPTESKLQFGEGFSVTDDSTNGKTIITPNDKTWITTDTYSITNTKINQCELYSCITNNFICLGMFFEVNDATQPVTLTFNNNIPLLRYGQESFLNYSGWAANSQITSVALISDRTITFPANLPFNYIRLQITHPLA